MCVRFPNTMVRWWCPRKFEDCQRLSVLSVSEALVKIQNFILSLSSLSMINLTSVRWKIHTFHQNSFFFGDSPLPKVGPATYLTSGRPSSLCLLVPLRSSLRYLARHMRYHYSSPFHYVDPLLVMVSEGSDCESSTLGEWGEERERETALAVFVLVRKSVHSRDQWGEVRPEWVGKCIINICN